MAVDPNIIQSILGRRNGTNEGGFNTGMIESEVRDTVGGSPKSFSEMRQQFEADPATKQELSAENDPTVVAARAALDRAVKEAERERGKLKFQRGLSALGAAIDPNKSYADVEAVNRQKEADIEGTLTERQQALETAVQEATKRRRQQREQALQLSAEQRAQLGFEDDRERAQSEEERARAAEQRAQAGEERTESEFGREQMDFEERNDPNSESSALLRTIIQTEMPDVVTGLEQVTGKSFSELSTADFERAEIPVDKLFDEYYSQREPDDVQKALAERRTERYIEAQDAALAADDEIAMVDEMIGLLDDVATGPIAGSALLDPVNQLLEGADRSRFRQLAADLQLGKTDQLAGVLSDSDMRLLRNSVANLGAEEDANLRSLQTTKHLLNKAKAKARWMRQQYEATGEVPDAMDVPQEILPTAPRGVRSTDGEDEQMSELEAAREELRRRQQRTGGQMGRR